MIYLLFQFSYIWLAQSHIGQDPGDSILHLGKRLLRRSTLLCYSYSALSISRVVTDINPKAFVKGGRFIELGVPNGPMTDTQSTAQRNRQRQTDIQTDRQYSWFLQSVVIKHNQSARKASYMHARAYLRIQRKIEINLGSRQLYLPFGISKVMYNMLQSTQTTEFPALDTRTCMQIMQYAYSLPHFAVCAPASPRSPRHRRHNHCLQNRPSNNASELDQYRYFGAVPGLELIDSLICSFQN